MQSNYSKIYYRAEEEERTRHESREICLLHIAVTHGKERFLGAMLFSTRQGGGKVGRASTAAAPALVDEVQLISAPYIHYEQTWGACSDPFRGPHTGHWTLVCLSVSSKEQSSS